MISIRDGLKRKRQVIGYNSGHRGLVNRIDTDRGYSGYTWQIKQL
jgi:hypothetical protein